MGRHRKVLLSVLAVWACVALSGCSFYGCSGGGPLTRAELGDWLQIPEGSRPAAEKLRADATELRGVSDSFLGLGGTHSRNAGTTVGRLKWGDPYEIPFHPAHGMAIKGKFNPWARLLPGTREGKWLYYTPSGENRREFYATENEWGCGMLVGDLIASGDRANAYDVGTGERIAARQTKVILTVLGYVNTRRVMPVDAEGKEGLHALSDASVDLSSARYSMKKGTTILAGVLGWGQVNRKRYLQILWIPIPTGDVEPAAIAAK